MFAKEMVGRRLQCLVAVNRRESADLDAVVDVEESTKCFTAKRLQVFHLPRISNNDHPFDLSQVELSFTM